MQYIHKKNHDPRWLDTQRTKADEIVQRVLDIIDYYKPVYWIMENPQSAALKTRSVVSNLPYIDADYCQYGYPYRKRTRFWTNRKVQLKLCQQDCPNANGSRHIQIIGQGRLEPKYIPLKGYYRSLTGRYSIPQDLLMELLPKPRQKIRLIKK